MWSSPPCRSTSAPVATSATRRWTEFVSSSTIECRTRREHSSTSWPPASTPLKGESSLHKYFFIFVLFFFFVQCNTKTVHLWLVTRCCSVGFRSVLSCVDDLDESRSLQLKCLLSEYFDKRRDRSHAVAPQEVEELAKYKVRRSVILTRAVSLFPFRRRVFVSLCSCPTGRTRSGPTSGVSSPHEVMRNSLEEPLQESCTA